MTDNPSPSQLPASPTTGSWEHPLDALAAVEPALGIKDAEIARLSKRVEYWQGRFQNASEDGDRLFQQWLMTRAEEREIRKRAERAEARLAEQENAVTWLTSCLNCSSLLDSSYADYVRAEQAEADVARLAADLAVMQTKASAWSEACGRAEAERARLYTTVERARYIATEAAASHSTERAQTGRELLADLGQLEAQPKETP